MKPVLFLGNCCQVRGIMLQEKHGIYLNCITLSLYLYKLNLYTVYALLKFIHQTYIAARFVKYLS